MSACRADRTAHQQIEERLAKASASGYVRVSTGARCIGYMYRLLLLLMLFVTGCSSWNVPECRQAHGAKPLPPAHPNLATVPRWTSFDGTRFPYQTWPAKRTSPRGVMIMIGGWDSTAIDYTVLGQHLANQGYQVYCSELRTGVYDPVVRRRGNPSDWRDWVSDLRSFTAWVMQKHPRQPLFYHGHSFGTLIALASALEQVESRPNFRGVIIQSPALPLMLKKQDLIKAAVLWPFQGLRVPQLQLGAGIDQSPTGDPDLNCAWACSPDRLQVGYKIRYFTQAAQLGYQVRSRCAKVRPPILALVGEKDVLVASSPRHKDEYRNYLRKELCAGHADVIDYPDGYHAMIVPPTGIEKVDRTSRKVLTDITRWLEKNRTGPQKKFPPPPSKISLLSSHRN